MILIPAILEGHRSLKDKTLKLTFETSEPSPEQFYEIAKNNQKYGFLAFKDDEFKTEQLESLNSMKADLETTGKTPSQRLRDILFCLWKQEDQGYKNFNDFYNRKMDDISNHFKSKLI